MKNIKKSFMKIFLAAGLMAFIPVFSYAQTSADFLDSYFTDKLSAEERTALYSGETIIRRLPDVRSFSFNQSLSNIKSIQEVVKRINPAYLGEVIKIIPATDDNFLEKFNSEIINVSNYVGIPYYSEHNDIWVDLYSYANILSESHEENHDEIKCVLHMIPFGDIETLITTNIFDDIYFYESVNTSGVKYNGITAVGKGKMKNEITVFRCGDYWVLYGIGAVNAPTFSFMRDRIEVSFMNRIKTFCSFFFNLFK